MNNFSVRFETFLDILINEGGYKDVIEGLKNTMTIAVVGLVIGIVIGTLIATVRVLPKYKRIVRALDSACKFYVGVFRGTPMVVQLLVFYYVLVPSITPILSDIFMQNIRVPSVIVAIIVFGLNSGAYISEIMRAGILSVDPGQLEGARSVGFSYGAAMIKVVIPQAIKNILPTLGNEFIALVKETSVVSFVGAMDLYLAFQRIGAGTYEYMIPYLAMAVVYIVIICLISLGIKIMERSLRKGDRK